MDRYERLLNKAWNETKDGNYRNAISLYTEALNLRPDDATTFALRAIAERQMGQFAQALSDSDRAMSLGTDDDLALYVRGSTLLALGRSNEAAEGLEHLTRAIADLERAVRLSPDDSSNRETLSEAYVARALRYQDLQRFNDGIADCTEAIGTDPSSDVAHYVRGNLYSELALGPRKAEAQELFSRAILDYERAIMLDPDDEDYRDAQEGAMDEVGELGGRLRVEALDPAFPQHRASSLNGDSSSEGSPIMDEEQKPVANMSSQDQFETTIVTRYDGSPHRMLNCTCTLASDRLIVVDGSGRMYQMLYRDITGVDPQPQGIMSSGVNIVGLRETWHITWKGKADRRQLASRISQAITAST